MENSVKQVEVNDHNCERFVWALFNTRTTDVFLIPGCGPFWLNDYGHKNDESMLKYDTNIS